MFLIAAFEGVRIVEDFRRLAEADSVFLQIGEGLRVVPLELHRRSSLHTFDVLRMHRDARHLAAVATLGRRLHLHRLRPLDVGHTFRAEAAFFTFRLVA